MIHTAAFRALIACLVLIPSLAIEQELPVDYRLNERVISIPAGPGKAARMETTVFRPNGDGPFPLLIINHGKDLGLPSQQQRDRFIVMATAFVKRGYAVMVPMREGFAASTGRYIDHGCDMTANGYTQAEDVRDAIDYAREQDWVDADHIIVAGQSYGGLATIALGAQDLPGVRGLLNFAGGLRDTDTRCDWSDALVSAFADYGRHNTGIPSLWMYGANDSLFAPELVTRMHDAYVRAGGQARLVQYAPFKRDAHGMLASQDGPKVWWKETERFLQRIGMPTEVRYVVASAPTISPTHFAPLDDVASVPFLSDRGRAAYRDYLQRDTPRAFALSASGAWSWAEEGEDPDSRALAACQRNSNNSPCQLYSINNDVVWPDDMGGNVRTAAGGL